MMRSCNRSEPHLQLLKVALSILRNISKYPELVGFVASPDVSVECIVDLLQMFRDKMEPFCLGVSVLQSIVKFKSEHQVRQNWGILSFFKC
jgi:abnormal spindle-like microcephaly-associated protein